MPGSDDEEGSSFRQRHIRYFKSCLVDLPEPYIGLETSRITAIYFAVVALDMLGALHEVDREAVVAYVYSLQIASGGGRSAGFIGSGYLGFPFCEHAPCRDGGHLAMSYTAIVVLKTLGDDLSRLRRGDLLSDMKKLQVENGSFSATRSGSESDMRFLYCACAISTLLGDWSAVDKDLAVGYIRACTTYEGGVSLVPGSEAQGGSTYCAIASLRLMGRLRTVPEDSSSIDTKTIDGIKEWCLLRQRKSGFCGRTNKESDTCYSFWNGASLAMLDSFHLSNVETTRAFVDDCESHFSGGFSKVPTYPPDILHSFYSLCWMSIAALEGVKSFNCALGICERC
ncbi:unnamed protein product [Ectocarpus fasciculatus]